jgi:Hypothetical protein (DUF2513)
MKRNIDLIRDILLSTESFEKERLGRSDLATLDSSKELIDFHLRLMTDGGLLAEHISKPSPAFLASWHGGYSVTWKGHDFLDSIRDPEIWRKTKEAANAAGGFTLETLGDIAKGLIKTQIKRLSGVDV